MERARPIPRERDWKDPRAHDRRGLLAIAAGLALTSAVLLTGCDSVSGIPGDEPAEAPARATTSSAAMPTTPSQTLTQAFTVPVGEAPGLPGAAEVASRFGATLERATPVELRSACWMMAPGNVSDMSTGKRAILNALAQPATVTRSLVTWQNAGTTVTFDRGAIASGIENAKQTVCPWVAQDGAEAGPNEADARHTVRRYLARLVSKPLDPADKEGDFPLICKANWDPNGTGSPTPAPLANNSSTLTGATKFADQEIQSEQLRSDYLAVHVPVTNSSGVTQTLTFTLTAGPKGYCIGDVSP
ncbi:hypothetical protein OG874_34955 [Nocardia sp. NBC_00565]|uniref:hypothetical protein n=1 Tax=Nocardia sp. NBC_00565 TaxID=2975993 RepID=UPI002E802EB3|nr:hypothetical protein [Nocardia sp. NBC_00565]WUC01901.1 hypothetical protein OG874_34955 [Nocardia sp. NBC_00565]